MYITLFSNDVSKYVAFQYLVITIISMFAKGIFICNINIL